MDLEAATQQAGVVPNAEATASPTEDASFIHLKGKEGKSETETNGATEKVGVPPGRINPKGKGDRWQPFPQIRRLARRGHHKKAEEARKEQHTIPQKDLSAVTDPCDDFIGVTDVKEVWFSGCHSGMYSRCRNKLVLSSNVLNRCGWRCCHE